MDTFYTLCAHYLQSHAHIMLLYHSQSDQIKYLCKHILNYLPTADKICFLNVDNMI